MLIIVQALPWPRKFKSPVRNAPGSSVTNLGIYPSKFLNRAYRRSIDQPTLPQVHQRLRTGPIDEVGPKIPALLMGSSSALGSCIHATICLRRPLSDRVSHWVPTHFWNPTARRALCVEIALLVPLRYRSIYRPDAIAVYCPKEEP